VLRLLGDTEWDRRSNVEISQHCGVNDECVRKLRKAIFQPLEDSGARKACRGGTVYERDTSRIGEHTPAGADDEPAADMNRAAIDASSRSPSQCCLERPFC
jgi:hypothetical protein